MKCTFTAHVVNRYDCKVTTFSNTETRIKPSDEESATFRGKDIIIVQSGCANNGKSVNDAHMELVLMMDACRRGNCRSITVICPHFSYGEKMLFTYYRLRLTIWQICPSRQEGYISRSNFGSMHRR